MNYDIGDKVYCPELIGSPRGTCLELTTEVPKSFQDDKPEKGTWFMLIQLYGQEYPVWVYAKYWKKVVERPKDYNPFAKFV